MKNETICRYVDIERNSVLYRVAVEIDVARICGYIGHKAVHNSTKRSRMYGVRASARMIQQTSTERTTL